MSFNIELRHHGNDRNRLKRDRDRRRNTNQERRKLDKLNMDYDYSPESSEYSSENSDAYTAVSYKPSSNMHDVTIKTTGFRGGKDSSTFNRRPKRTD